MSDPAENRDVRGNTIKPHSVEAENVKAQNATVESEPSDANEIARKVDIDAKADLDSTTGVLKSSQVPDLAITSVSTVPDKASRLALSVEEGDVAIQTDTDTTYIFTGGDPSVNANWSEIVLDVLDAISGSTISPDTVNAGSVKTDHLKWTLSTPSDEKANRDVNRWETNTTEYPIYVFVTLEIDAAELSAGDAIRPRISINNTQSDNVVIDPLDQAGGSHFNLRTTYKFIVAPGSHYKVAPQYRGGDNSLISVNDRFESKLGVSE